MDSLEKNLQSLQAEFHDGGEAARGLKNLVNNYLDPDNQLDLAHLLRFHDPNPVEGLELIHRIEIDALLDYYSLLLVAIFSGYVPSKLTDKLRNEIILILENRYVKSYYVTYYPYLMVANVLQYVKEDFDHKQEPNPETIGAFTEFISLIRVLKTDKDIERFLGMLDFVWYEGESMSEVNGILSSFQGLNEVFISKDTSQAARGVWGFVKYTSFISQLRTLLNNPNQYPLLQSALWMFHGYYFDRIDSKMIDFLDKSFDNITHAISSQELFTEIVKELMLDNDAIELDENDLHSFAISAVQQAREDMHFVLDNSWGNALKKYFAIGETKSSLHRLKIEKSDLKTADDGKNRNSDEAFVTTSQHGSSKTTPVEIRSTQKKMTSGDNYFAIQSEVPLEKVKRLSHGFRRTMFGMSPSFVENSKRDRFGYLFNSRSSIPYTPANRALLEDLGLNMLEDSATAQIENSTIESGYTYFGQFIDHDITLDVDSDIDVPRSAKTLINYRTPNLELDSVYGDGPGVDSFLYDQEGVKLLVANTIIGGADDTIPIMPFDLQRNINGKAIIGDPRNDENLFVAQIHMSIIKFHNAVVDAIRSEEPTLTPDKLFPKVQTEVRRHYQWVLMHDYLKKIIGQARVEEVLQNGPTLMPANRKFFMPVEFSVAAYRFGHSQIRDAYRFNQVFSNSEFFWAFTFTGRIVPSDWIINWRSFFTVDGVPAANMARKIDTRVAFTMGQLPGSAPQGSFFATLSSRNLVRSIALRVGTGKAIAKKLGVTPLTEEELLRSPFANPTPNQVLLHQRTVEILQSEGGLLLKKTPLWYYVLKEAEILNQGNQLGPVGGSIVGEVFIRLLKQSKDSFLNDPAWRPKFGVINGDPESFKIVDMLRLAGTLDIPGIN